MIFIDLKIRLKYKRKKNRNRAEQIFFEIKMKGYPTIDLMIYRE